MNAEEREAMERANRLAEELLDRDWREQGVPQEELDQSRLLAQQFTAALDAGKTVDDVLVQWEEITERECLIKQVLDAATMLEVEAATAALDRWMAAHPNDQGMGDGYEQLALMKEGLLLEAQQEAVTMPIAKAS